MQLRKLILIVVVLFVLTVGFHRSCGPFYYSSDLIYAQVIDETTGYPVEGAVVVAIWMLDSPWYTDRPLHASEAVTDRMGNFVIPAMRKRRPWLMFLDFRDPEITVYKPGFRLAGGDNRSLYAPTIYSGASKRPSFWNGRTIPMKPLAPEDRESRAQAFKRMLSDASFHSLAPDQFPNLWRTLVDEHPKVSPVDVPSPKDYIAHWKEREP